MSRSVFVIVFIGVMLVAEPLWGRNAPQPAAPTNLPDVALPPHLDRVLRDYERAWRAGDAAALATLFAEDGFLLQSDRPPVRGRPAIRAAYAGQAGGPLRLRALAFAAGDASGYIIGVYGYANTSGDTGKFTLTLRRMPGEPWLIVSDMDNMNTSPQHPSVTDSPEQ